MQDIIGSSNKFDNLGFSRYNGGIPERINVTYKIQLLRVVYWRGSQYSRLEKEVAAKAVAPVL